MNEGRKKTRGEGNKQAKLSRMEVWAIRNNVVATVRTLAKRYKISTTQVWRIQHRKNWAWL